MCQFVAIKPTCGCLMNRRADSDSCLEWDWWAHSGKNGTQWNKCGLSSSTHCAARQTERAERGEDMRAGADFEWWCEVVSLTNRTLTRPDGGVARIFLIFFISSVCLFAVPNFLWWSRRLAAASAMVWRKSGRDRKGEVAQVRRKAGKIIKAFQQKIHF